MDEVPPIFPEKIFFFKSCAVLFCAREICVVKISIAKQENSLVIDFIGLSNNQKRYRILMTNSSA